MATLGDLQSGTGDNENCPALFQVENANIVEGQTSLVATANRIHALELAHMSCRHVTRNGKHNFPSAWNPLQ